MKKRNKIILGIAGGVLGLGAIAALAAQPRPQICPMGQTWCATLAKCLPSGTPCPQCPSGQFWCVSTSKCLPNGTPCGGPPPVQIASITGPSPLTATKTLGQSLTIIGQALDSSSQPVPNAVLYPVVEEPGKPTVVETSIKCDSTGHYTFSYSPAVAETVTIWLASNSNGT